MGKAKQKGAAIESRILKTELVEWRKLSWLQGELKEITREAMDKLKESIRVNGFVAPFHAWEEKRGKVWILDGHHRKLAMEELERDGAALPAKLPANYVTCRSRADALRLVLVYSSVYARANEASLFKFLGDGKLDFAELKVILDLPDFDLPRFEADFMLPHEGKEFTEGDADGLKICVCKKCGNEHARKD